MTVPLAVWLEVENWPRTQVSSVAVSSLIVKSMAREKRTWKCRLKRSFPAKCAGSLVLRHVSRCSYRRSKTTGEKNAEREDFRGANHLCVDNGQNRSVQLWLRLLSGITMMERQAQKGRERRKPQRTHRMWVSFIDFTCKIVVVTHTLGLGPYGG